MRTPTNAVFESLMETALEENRRMNSDRAEALLLRAYNMYRHPLLISLQSQAAAALLDPSTSSTAFKGVCPSHSGLMRQSVRVYRAHMYTHRI